MFDTSGIGTSETALQCNFELIPVQIEALASYVPGSSVALIVRSQVRQRQCNFDISVVHSPRNRITRSFQQQAGPL